MKFKAISYNIFCRNRFLFSDAQTKRAKRIPSALVDYCNDIDCILLQEVFDEKSEKILDKEMEKYGFKYKSRKVGGKNWLKCQCFCGKIEDGGVKTYSRYPIIAQCQIIFENAGKTDKLSNKGCLYTRIIKENIVFNVFNTHLEAGDTNDIRYKQVNEINNFIKELNLGKESVVVIGGDFNVDDRYTSFVKVRETLNMRSIKMDESTFNDEKNEMQKRSNPEQEHEKKQGQVDTFLIHNEHKQPEKDIRLFTNLKAKKPFKIKKLFKECCCKNIWTYWGNQYMTSLSDHEPILAILDF